MPPRLVLSHQMICLCKIAQLQRKWIANRPSLRYQRLLLNHLRQTQSENIRLEKLSKVKSFKNYRIQFRQRLTLIKRQHYHHRNPIIMDWMAKIRNLQRRKTCCRREQLSKSLKRMNKSRKNNERKKKMTFLMFKNSCLFRLQSKLTQIR